jgi:hypothetical protein
MVKAVITTKDEGRVWMIKNLIILFLIYIIGVLLFASSSNVDLLKQKAVEAKESILNGATWFKTQVEESDPKENNNVDPQFAPNPLPSEHGQQSNQIQEETFSEKSKKE